MSKAQLVFIVTAYCDLHHLYPIYLQDEQGIPRLFLKDKYEKHKFGSKLPFYDDLKKVYSHFFRHGQLVDGARPCQVAVELMPECGFGETLIAKAMKLAPAQ